MAAITTKLYTQLCLVLLLVAFKYPTLAYEFNLTENYCHLEQQMTLGIEETSDIIENTNLIQMMIQHLDLLSDIQGFPEVEKLNSETFCSSLTTCQKFGEPFSILALDNIKHLKGTFMFNVYYIRTLNNNYCQIDEIVANTTYCTQELAKLANIVGSSELTFPNMEFSVSYYNPFKLAEAATFVLVLDNGNFRFTSTLTDSVCCFDAGLIDLSYLHTDNLNLLKENIKNIFFFVQPMTITSTYEEETLFCNNSNIIDLWLNFELHAPKLYFILSQQFKKFPKIVFSKDDCFLPLPIRQYIQIMSVIDNKLIFKRSLWNAIFNEDTLDQLSKNSGIISDNFNKVKLNENSLLKNQKKLASNANQLFKYANSNQKNLEKLQRQIEHLFSDLLLANLHRDVMFNLIELSQITHANYLFLSNQNQLITETINDILKVGFNNCKYNDGEVICANKKANFVLSSDLLAIYSGRKLSFQPQTYIVCLPQKDGNRFLAHKKSFILKDNFFVDKEKFAFSKHCLDSLHLCQNQYQLQPEPDLFGICFLIHNFYSLAISCKTEITVEIAGGTSLHLNQNPTVIPVSFLPLKYKNATFSLKDVEITLNHHNSSNHFENHINFTSEIINIIQSSNFQLITQQPTLLEDVNDLVSPSRVSGHHIVSYSLFALILLILLCCCACYCNSLIFRNACNYFCCFIFNFRKRKHISRHRQAKTSEEERLQQENKPFQQPPSSGSSVKRKISRYFQAAPHIDSDSLQLEDRPLSIVHTPAK